MSGCRSCSSCSPAPSISPTKKAEKLQKGERSDNPRYPHVFVGKQAIFSAKDVQVIVTVVADDCDEQCDNFTLQSQRILKDTGKQRSVGDSFEVSQPAGQSLWKLRALI
jgi:hypothetical protein